MAGPSASGARILHTTAHILGRLSYHIPATREVGWIVTEQEWNSLGQVRVKYYVSP